MKIPSIKEINAKLSEHIDFTIFYALRVFFGIVASLNQLLVLKHNNQFDYCFKPYEVYFNFFDMVRPLPIQLMKVLVIVSAINGIGIAFGFLYRLNSIMYFLLSVYFLLSSEIYYQNHYYLIILISFLFCFIPLNSNRSIDVKIFPKIKKETLPLGYLWIFKAQIIIVFLFGAIAKISPDWLKGYPMRIWLETFPTMVFFGDLRSSKYFAYTLSYGGLLFDLLIVPGLLYKKTRKISLILLAGFNVLNYNMFNIGVFPFLAFGITTMLFTDWNTKKIINKNDKRTTSPSWHFFWAYIIIQILVPMRGFLYPGNPSWTGKGSLFSWRMRLNEMNSDLSFVVILPENNQRIEIGPQSAHPYLTKIQYNYLIIEPALVLKTAKHIANDFYKKTGKYPKVYVTGLAQRNGRQPRPLVDSSVDLAQENYRFFTSYPWIVQETEDLDW